MYFRQGGIVNPSRASRGSSSTTSGNESRINAKSTNPLQKHKTTTNLSNENYQQKVPLKYEDSGRSSESSPSSTRSSDSERVSQPPRRPPKPQPDQENRKSFMNDPRNRVLPTATK